MAIGTTTAAIIGGGMLVGGAAQALGNRSARKAQGEAAQQSIEEMRRIRAENEGFANEFGERAQGDIDRGFGQARAVMRFGADAADRRLMGGFEDQRGALSEGFGSAQDRLGRLSGRLLGDDPRALAEMGARQDRLGALLDEGLYSGFEEDPGFQYRLQQSEDAINRAAAARGGRLSGATLQALQGNAQGLASQEFANFANRRNAMAQMAAGSDQAAMRQQLAQNANNMNLLGTGVNLRSQQATNDRMLGQLLGQSSAAQGRAGSALEMQNAGNLANLATAQGNALSNIEAQRLSALTGASLPLQNALPQLNQIGAGSGLADAASAFNNTLNQGMQLYALSGGFAPPAGGG